MPRNFYRPDFSDYVVHFTKDAAPFSIKREPTKELNRIADLSASGRLISILTEKRIRATRMPWTNQPAICFTECTWASLLDHATHYSRFGIGFSKAYLFSRGGGPAIYLALGLLEHQKAYAGHNNLPFEPRLFAFMTPFMPPYAPKDYRDRFWRKTKSVDYTHEREWRVPHDLDFDLEHVEFVIVASYSDMARAPKPLKDGIGRDKWLIMDNYARIEHLWPVHRIPD